ncbi:hypothetical protein XU18_4490 [Perkinsela sp. CCAP 1560/4]|nr:hypothetical protein XU18_4490 [Perkinsela sp. CCAP 1560/4]|eukprot:KNH04280.1 hypothetical protein XU18_4490 [Perkinsela sp. CCAP 1560/4]
MIVRLCTIKALVIGQHVRHSSAVANEKQRPASSHAGVTVHSMRPILSNLGFLKNTSIQDTQVVSLQNTLDKFVWFLDNDFRQVDVVSIRRDIGKFVSLHNWVMKLAGLLLMRLHHLSKEHTPGAHRAELDKFPPPLVISLLKYLVFLRDLRDATKRRRLGKADLASIPERNMMVFAKSLDLDLARRLFILLRARIHKIMPQVTVHEGVSIIRLWGNLRPKDPTFVKLLTKFFAKKLRALCEKHDFLGLHEVARFVPSDTALQLIVKMAETKVPNTRLTHELAHALVPSIIQKDIHQLSVVNIVKLLSTFSKYELQNEYLQVIHRFCALVAEGRTEPKHIVNALSSIVKIPETPADVIAFLYLTLTRQWGEARKSNTEFQPSFRPLINLIDTDFTWWSAVFEGLMTEMQLYWGPIMEASIGCDLNGKHSNTTHVRTLLRSATAVLNGLAHRESTVPSHPFLEKLLAFNFAYLGTLESKQVVQFLHAASILRMHNLKDLRWSEALPVLLNKIDSMDTRGVAYAVFIIGTQCAAQLSEAQKSHVLMKWTAANACLHSKTLAMSIYGLGSIQPSMDEMQRKAVTSLCEKRLIRYFDCRDIVLFCTGLRNLGLSIEEYPEPFLMCMRRAIAQCPSMELDHLPRILLTFAQCGLTNTKLNVYAMRRIVKEKESMDFDTFLESIEALLWVMGSDRVLYGDDLVQMLKFTRNTILTGIHKASPDRCVRMLNACAVLMPYDTAVVRTICYAMNAQSAHIEQCIPTGNASAPSLVLSPSAMLSALPYAASKPSYESALLGALRQCMRDLQPNELQRLLYMCIPHMCSPDNTSRAAAYADMYEVTRWMLIDSLLEDAHDLTKKSHRIRRVLPESLLSLLLTMCDTGFCDTYFLTIFLRLGKGALRKMNVQMLVLCASCLSELGVLSMDEFRFFVKAIRSQAERKSEEFTSVEIQSLLHILWNNGIRTSSRLVTFLGERASEIASCETSNV